MKELISSLQKAKEITNKLQILSKEPLVEEFAKNCASYYSEILQLKVDEQYVIFCLIVLDQAKTIFLSSKQNDPSVSSKIKELATSLLKVEIFYSEIGGILGYHQLVMQLIKEQKKSDQSIKNHHYYEPQYRDIRFLNHEVQEKIDLAIEQLPEVAAIFPLGGAGDRLDLIDSKTKEPLPAAVLPFGGKTLLENLLFDIQALENLYFEKFNKQLIIPIVMMTSSEKHNHEKIIQICKEHNWFGRPKESYFFVQQISVPMIAEDGSWIVPKPFSILMKPGGHGAIWKLMEDEKVFSWLEKKGCKKAFVRQINNIVAGIDYGLLALIGYGIESKKSMGFAGCPRIVNSAQGTVVLHEEKKLDGYDAGITNIEYVDFSKWEIEDICASQDSHYSKYPANTNLLFADLLAIKNAIKKCSLPGRVINLKHSFLTLQQSGLKIEKKAGRLELMMQNIADSMMDHFDHPIAKDEQDSLSTYLTYNERIKTISAIKQSLPQDKSLLETPEGAFYDLLRNHYDLLTNYCKMKVPHLCDEKNFLEKGPSFIFFYHPALGPLYNLISQKIKKGKMQPLSEMQLYIADLALENVDLTGSLLIHANAMMGKSNIEEKSYYNENRGRCILQNVTIENEGIDYLADNIFWKNQIFRKQSLSIVLQGKSEFIAKDIKIQGDYHIEVPDNHRITAYEEHGEIRFKKEVL